MRVHLPLHIRWYSGGMSKKTYDSSPRQMTFSQFNFGVLFFCSAKESVSHFHLSLPSDRKNIFVSEQKTGWKWKLNYVRSKFVCRLLHYEAYILSTIRNGIETPKKMLAPWIIHEKYGEHIWWDKNHKFLAQLSFYFDKCYIHIRCIKSDIFVVALLYHLSNRRHHQTSTTWRICFNISSCSHYYIANRMHWSHTTEVVLFFCFRDEVQWGEAITFDSNANYSKFCTL